MASVSTPGLPASLATDYPRLGHVSLSPAPSIKTAQATRMPLTSFLLNLLWIVFGGLWMALGWVIAAILMAITIIGLPWARAALNIALYTLLPFGQTAVSRAAYTGREDLGTGPLGAIGNLIWLVLAGWWLALGHLITAAVLAITIIGIPFAWAHLKLARVALWPIGKMIVPIEDLQFRR
jgi:uncharacterized membrane protein YccF (DUF307 family)